MERVGKLDELRHRSALGALGDQPPVLAAGVERGSQATAASEAAARSQPTAPRPSRRADRAPRSAAPGSALVVERGGLQAPPATASVAAAAVPHSRSPAGATVLPGAGEHRAEEVLARERDVDSGRPRSRSSPSRRRISRSSATPRGRSRGPGRGRSAPRRLRAPAPPRAARRTSASGARRRRRSRGGRGPRAAALDVHDHQAAAASGASSKQLGSLPPPMSLIATAPAVERRRRPRARRCRRRSAARSPRRAPRSPGPAAALVVGGDRRPAAGRDRADVEHVEPGLGRARGRPRPPARGCRCGRPRTSSPR